MGRVTKADPHSDEELGARLEPAKNRNHARELLVILNAAGNPIRAEDVGLHTGEGAILFIAGSP
jgi:hypothetical protein